MPKGKRLSKKTKKAVYLTLSIGFVIFALMFYRLENISETPCHAVSSLFLLSFTVFLFKYLKLRKNPFR